MANRRDADMVARMRVEIQHGTIRGDEFVSCDRADADLTSFHCYDEHPSGDGEVGLSILYPDAVDGDFAALIAEAQRAIDHAKMRPWDPLA